MKKEWNMEDKLSRFYKFIVRNIVDSIEYLPESDEYRIRRVPISDDLLNRITEEGERYGLMHDESLRLVRRISENIDMKPHKNIHKGQFIASDVPIGQHFEVRFNHPDKGENYIELLCTDEQVFIVLSSSITGLNTLDKLIPITLHWNPDFFIDFLVYRKNVRYPDEKTRLQIGKFSHIIVFEPSIVFEVLDSDRNFSFIEGQNMDRWKKRLVKEGKGNLRQNS